jgi:hypothetical protein
MPLIIRVRWKGSFSFPKRLPANVPLKRHHFRLTSQFSQSHCLSPLAKKQNSPPPGLSSRTVQAAMSDDDVDPDYVLFLQNYDEFAVYAPGEGEDEDEDENEDEDEDENEDEDEDEEDGEDEEYVPELESPRVEEGGRKRSRTQGGEACCSYGVGSAENSQGNEWNRSEIDGLFCPICMEAWTTDGGHYIWCQCLLFLGHFFTCIRIFRTLNPRVLFRLH